MSPWSVTSATVVGAGTVAVVVAHRHPAFSFAGTTPGAVALSLAGTALIAGAIVLRRSRPHDVVGPMLMAASALWFVGEWDNPGIGVAAAFTAGLLLSGAQAPVVGAAMVLSTVAPADRRARHMIAVALAAAIICLGVLPTLHFDPAATGCSTCPDNLVLLEGDADRSTSLFRAGLSVSLASMAALAAVGLWGLARSTGARRRRAAPFVVAAVAHLGITGWMYAASLEQGFIASGPLEERLWFAQALTLIGFGATAAWPQISTRRARSRVAALVVGLDETLQGAGVRDVLASVLGDDDLTVAYPLGHGRHARADGTEVDCTPLGDRVQTRLVRNGEEVAILVHRRGLLDDAVLVAELTASAQLALENERLRAQVRAEEADLRASRARVVEASDAARRRAERDVHDGAQQQLVALLFSLQLARSGSAVRVVGALERLDRATQHLQGAIDELREVAHGLHPLALSEEGLAAAVDSLLEHAVSPVPIIDVPQERFAPAIESALYRIVVEATSAGASHVRFSRPPDAVRVEIESENGLDRLLALEDRVGALDGRLSPMASNLVVEIPCGVRS